jgi:hypothetical protein
MTEVAEALYSFFSSFEIPAYVEEIIPDDAQLPYITYRLVDPAWGEQVSLPARIWYKDTKLTSINAKSADIKQAIGQGKSIKTKSGFVTIFADTNFAQYQPYDSEGQSNVKVVYLSLILEAYTRR